jgi:hypothetical protein
LVDASSVLGVEAVEELIGISSSKKLAPDGATGRRCNAGGAWWEDWPPVLLNGLFDLGWNSVDMVGIGGESGRPIREVLNVLK